MHCHTLFFSQKNIFLQFESLCAADFLAIARRFAFDFIPDIPRHEARHLGCNVTLVVDEFASKLWEAHSWTVSFGVFLNLPVPLNTVWPVVRCTVLDFLVWMGQ